MLEDDGHRPWPKLPGGKGLHMMVPVAPRLTHHRARSYCKVPAQKPAVSAPKRYALSPEPNEICARVADWRVIFRQSARIGAILMVLPSAVAFGVFRHGSVA